MTINEITIFPAVTKANVGSTINFTYQISPAEYDRNISFTSSNNAIMTVKNQCMRFLSEGNVSLIISSTDGYERRYNIAVGKALNGLNKTQAEIEEALIKLEEQIIKNINAQSQLITENIRGQQTELFAKTNEFKRLLLLDYNRLRKEYEDSIIQDMNNKVEAFENRIISEIDIYNRTIEKDKNSAYELLTSIRKTSETLLSDLENNFQNKYNDFKSELSKLISEKKDTLTSEIELLSSNLKNNVNNQLKQLDNTLNYSLDKIEAGMHVAIDNIESAEATALSNISVLKDEIINKINSSIDNIDEIITRHVNEAEQRINRITDDAISNLRRAEIELKNNLEKATEASLAKLDVKLNNLCEQLIDKEQLLESELVAKKTELMQEINVNKDEFILEMTKVKAQLLGQFTDEVAIFFNALSKREQEIIANIVETVNGYDLDIEVIIDAKVEMFRASIEVIYTSFINNFKLMLDETLINFGNLKEEYLDTLLNALNSHLDDLQTAYNKHESDLNVLLEAHIATLNTLQKEILDFIGRTSENGLWAEIRADILAYTENQIERINEVKNSAISRIGLADDAMFDETTPSVRKDAIDAINARKELVVGGILGEASELVRDFISTLTEQRYTCVLPPNTTLIQLPSDFSLGHRVRLYIDGILLILDNHYNIDKLKRTITLTQPYTTYVDVHVTEDLPDVNIQSIKDQLYVDGEEYKKNTLKLFEDESARHTTNFDNHFEEKKAEIDEYTESVSKASADKYINETGKSMIDTYVETDSYVKINTHTSEKIKQLDSHTVTKESQLNEHTVVKEEEINKHTELKKEEINEHSKTVTQEAVNAIEDKKNTSTSEMINNSQLAINSYISSLFEQQFYYELPSGNTVIQLPNDFVTNNKTKVFFNGKLQNINKQYSINKDLNTVNLSEAYSTKIEVFVITDYPTNDYSELQIKVNKLESLIVGLQNEIDDLRSGGTNN